MIVFRIVESDFLAHDDEIMSWIAENAPDRAQAFTASAPGNPALVAFLKESDAVAFKITWSECIQFYSTARAKIP